MTQKPQNSEITINDLRMAFTKIRATEQELKELQILVRKFREEIEKATKLLEEAETINKELKENA